MRPLRVLRFVVSVLLLGWVLYASVARQGSEALWSRLAALHGPWLFVACALPCVAVLLGVFRWRVLLREEGVELPLTWLVRHTLIGRFVGAFTPSTAGLDGYRTLAVARHTGEVAAASRALVLEKVVGLVGLAAVTALCAALGLRGMSMETAWLAIFACLAMSASGYVLVKHPVSIARRIPTRHVLAERVRSLLLKLSGSSAARGPLVSALVLGLLSHAVTAAVFVASARALGLELDLATLFGVGNAIVLATLLPVSIGGVGVREGVAVLLLGAVGVHAAHAVLVALVGYLGGQVPAIMGGLIAALGRGEPARK